MKSRACVCAVWVLSMVSVGTDASPLRDSIARLRAEPVTQPDVQPIADPDDADPDEAGPDEAGSDSAEPDPADGGAGLADRLRAIFDEAIAADETSGDDLARAYLDAAVLVAERGDLDASAAFFREADLWGDARDLRARARFNYAQTRFRQARQEMMGVAAPAPGTEGAGLMGAMQGMMNGSPSGQQGPDVEAVKALLLDSANAFRAVLDIDPGDAEAARHVERVRRLIRSLEEQQEQQQQEQQQDGDEGDEEHQGEDGEQGDQPQDGEQPGEQSDEAQGEEESESDRISDWLLEREERQREQRDRQLRALRGRPVPVERDW